MENALEEMAASSDSLSVAAISMIINKFAQKVNVKPESTYNRYNALDLKRHDMDPFVSIGTIWVIIYYVSLF